MENSKQFRDSFASVLNEVRKIDPPLAQKILAEAQNTDIYKLSKKQKEEQNFTDDDVQNSISTTKKLEVHRDNIKKLESLIGTFDDMDILLPMSRIDVEKMDSEIYILEEKMNANYSSKEDLIAEFKERLKKLST